MRSRHIALAAFFIGALCVFGNDRVIWAQTDVDKEWDALTRSVMGDYETAKRALTISEKTHAPVGTAANSRVTETAMAKTLRHYNANLSVTVATEYAELIGDACRRYGVDPALMTAVIIRESRGDHRALSGSGAVGLTQVHWKVHRRSIATTFPSIRTRHALFEPRNNIAVGTWIFSGCLRAAGGDVRSALTRYLGSSNSVYVNQVLEYRRQVLRYR